LTPEATTPAAARPRADPTAVPSVPAADEAVRLAGDRESLRRMLRARRRALGPARRAADARAILHHIAATRWLRAPRPVGLYVSVGFEVATDGLRELARRRRCPVYLPHICDYRRRGMRFAADTGSATALNRHGIPEPAGGASVPARSLAVVFLPLLGFDAAGVRIGSGAGYYDRLFAFRRLRRHWRRPLLVGLAYGCQCVDRIDPGRHDVPLDAIVTERGVEYF
jgi:5-formyltetrahydrofolate cyclo-ligase